MHPRRITGIVAGVMLCFIGSAFGEQIDDTTGLHRRLTQIRQSDCRDYIANARILIPQFHNQGKFDSAVSIIDYIEARCADHPFKPYRLLRQIEAGTLDSDWCDTMTTNEILYGYTYWEGYPVIPYRLYDEPADAYSLLLRHFALELLNTIQMNALGQSIATYYALGRDTLLARLAERSYPGTCMQAGYDSQIDSLLHRRRGFANNWSLQVGAWVPSGELELLGPKLELGLQGGLRWRRFGGDLTFFMRAFKSREPYVVNYKGTPYVTDNYFGLYFSADPVLRVYTTGKYSIEAFGGIGYDGIMALTADDVNGEYAEYINSVNFNLGATLRLFYGQKHTRYFGLQARFHVVDYSTRGGTDLSGNAVSINLLWGNMGHGWVDRSLERMHYFR